MTKVNIVTTTTPTNENGTTTTTNNNNSDTLTTNNNNNDSDHNNHNCDRNTDDKSPNSELKPILTNTNSTSNSLVRKKSVTFDNHLNENDEVIQKFVAGDIIVDQQNPFKSNSSDSLDLDILESSDITTSNGGKRRIIRVITTKTNNFTNLSDDDCKITTEDVLKQSKYVKTYIKNPDPYFTYDHTLRDRILSEDETDSVQINVPKEKPRIPVPKPRLIGNGYPSNNFNSNSIQKPNHVNNTKIIKKNLKNSNSGIKYPDLADLKIKTGTDQDECLYNPIEVAINVKKFDDRFKKANLGSQDDLDEIGEYTSTKRDDQVDGESSPETEDEPKLPYNTNTVTSKEFQEFLKSKGLTLKPDLGYTVSDSESHDMEQQKIKKRSMLGRLFGGGIFAKTGKTTPKASTPQHTQTLNARPSNSINNSNANKRVVLERQSMQLPTSSRAPIYRDQDDQTSSISSQLTAADDYIDMNGHDSNDSKINSSPLRRSLRVENNPNALKLKQTYSQPEQQPVKNRVLSQSKIRPPTGRNSAPVTYLTDRQEPRILNNGSVVLERRPSEKSQPLSFVQKSPQLSNGVVAPRAQRPNVVVTSTNGDVQKSKIKPPVPIRRNIPERQSLGLRKADETDAGQSLYGNINRASSLNRNHRVIQSVPAQVKISRSPVIYSPAANERVEKNAANNCDTITPSNSNEKLLEPKSTSTPKEIVAQQNPQPVQIQQHNKHGWEKLQQIKHPNDQTLYGVNIITPENLYGKARRNSIQTENIYESTDKIAALQAQHAIYQQQFVRSSPQRNTIGSIYRNRTGQRPALRLPPNSAENTMQRNVPARSQSVLDNMTTMQYYQQTPVVMRHPSNSQTSQNSLNKEDVMNKVREFCRRSMNKTPTGSSGSRDLLVVDSKSKKDISPVSYASVEGREHAKYEQKPPQIPQRTQSLQSKQNSDMYHHQQYQANIPIYGPIVKRSSLYSTTSEMEDNSPRQNLVLVHQAQNPQQQQSIQSYKSETDSVFLPADENNVRQPIKLSPRHVLIPQDNMEIYGKINPQYGYLPVRDNNNTNALYSIPIKRNILVSPNSQGLYSTVRPTNNVRYTVDGRGTPLILYSIPHSPQKLVVKPINSSSNNNNNNNSNNVNSIEQMYRPIVPSKVSQPYYHRNVVQQQPQQQHQQQQHHSNQQQISPSVIYGYVPYESESGSEAGEVQRIMQSRRYIAVSRL